MEKNKSHFLSGHSDHFRINFRRFRSVFGMVLSRFWTLSNEFRTVLHPFRIDFLLFHRHCCCDHRFRYRRCPHCHSPFPPTPRMIKKIASAPFSTDGMAETQLCKVLCRDPFSRPSVFRLAPLCSTITAHFRCKWVLEKQLSLLDMGPLPIYETNSCNLAVLGKNYGDHTFFFLFPFVVFWDFDQPRSDTQKNNRSVARDLFYCWLSFKK